MFKLDSKFVKALDWMLPIPFIGYGLFSSSYILIGVGILGLLAAWYRPASRMKNAIKRKK